MIINRVNPYNTSWMSETMQVWKSLAPPSVYVHRFAVNKAGDEYRVEKRAKRKAAA